MEPLDFVKNAETLQKDERTLDRAALETAVKKLRALKKDAKESFCGDTKMTDLSAYLEHMWQGLPPVKFLEDIRDYYYSVQRELEARVLPDILKLAGLSQVVTSTGDEVTLKQLVTASLGDEEKFSVWAEAHGCADILKYKFSIRKGEDIQAVREKLNEAGVNYVQGLDKQGLAQSLGKLARDLLDDGKPLPPDDALSVYIVEEAKLK